MKLIKSLLRTGVTIDSKLLKSRLWINVVDGCLLTKLMRVSSWFIHFGDL